MNPEMVLIAAAIFVVGHALYEMLMLVIRCPEQRVFDDLAAMETLFHGERPDEQCER
jgi:hypothetical protein